MIRALLRFLFSEPPDVLPPPDRSVYRGIEVAGRMAVLRAKRQREA